MARGEAGALFLALIGHRPILSPAGRGRGRLVLLGSIQTGARHDAVSDHAGRNSSSHTLHHGRASFGDFESRRHFQRHFLRLDMTRDPVIKRSDFQWDEKVVTAVGNLIAPQVVCRLNLSAALPARAVYLFFEAVPTAPAEDFQVEAQIEFYRNGALVYSFPASIASNAVAAGGGANLV